MNMKSFLLEIVTPERVVYRGNVNYLNLPAYKGSMGVLPGHIDYLAELLPGEIKIDIAGETKFLAISGGFADIHQKNVVILCETAESAEEIDIERAKQAKLRAEQKLKTTDKNTAQIQVLLQKALARLKVVSDLQKKRRKRQ
jgi:F-type H+-transporting ATPase subunit epsilon